LSYRRASESSPKGRSSTMTVCTNDVAKGDLVEYGLPVTVGQTSGDVEVLLPDMVELQDERVVLAAVDTRLLAEELDEIRSAFGHQRLFSSYCIRDISRAV
jgi:hypothetical protein